MTTLAGNPNRRDLERALLQVGGQVEVIRRTGEVRYSHPALERSVYQNRRRKDATKRSVRFVREVLARLGGAR